MSKVKPEAFIINGTSGNISFVMDNQTHYIHKEHKNYEAIKNCFKTGDYDNIVDLCTQKFNKLTSLGKGMVTVEAGLVSYNGRQVNNAVTAQIIRLLEEGLPVQNLINFLENLFQNPSKRSLEQLYNFVEKHDILIDDNGMLVFFKGVREDLLDCHSATYVNAVGATLTMDRNQVDDDPDSGCSTGFHLANRDYARGYGTRLMRCICHPKDVVSVPKDANWQKLRVCSYTVVGEEKG